MDRPLGENTVRNDRLKTGLKVLIWGGVFVIALMSFRSLISPSVSRAEVRTSVVTRGMIEASLSAGGTVIPKEEEVITSEITGQVIEVIARPGQSVKQGDLIVKLDTNRVQVDLDSLAERIAVKENQILSKQLQTRKVLNNTTSRIELLEVDLESRKTRFERLKLLASSGATAKHDLLEAELNVKRTSIEIRQLKTSLVDLRESTDAEIAGIGLEKSILEKEQAEKQRLLESATVKASRDGILTWVEEQEGTSITPGQPLARIADLTQFKVEATLSDFYADQLHEGQLVNVRQANKDLNGVIKTILPTIDNGVVTVLVELDDPGTPGLRSNMRVDVDIVTGVINDTLIIKQGPFVSGRGVHDVFVIENNTAVKRTVEIGLGNVDNYQVLRGLNEGDEVIISNMTDYLSMKEISVN